MNKTILIDKTKRPRNRDAKILARLMGVSIFTQDNLKLMSALGFTIRTTEVMRSSLVLTSN